MDTLDKSNRRLDILDELKGFAILLVVAGHFIQYNIKNQHHALESWIYSFHMPLFFAISGFIAYQFATPKNYTKKAFLPFLGNKFLRLIIPFLAWGLIVPCFYISFSNVTYLTYLQDLLIENKGLWFLSTLFGFSIIFFGYFSLFDTKNHFKAIMMETGFILLVFVSLYLLNRYSLGGGIIRTMKSYVLFYFGGVLFSKYDSLQKICKKGIFFSLLFILFMFTSLHFEYTKSETLMNQLLKVITGLISIPIFFGLFKVTIFNSRIKYFLQLFGENSLVIYASHFLIIRFYPDLIPENIFLGSLLLITSFFSILICFACLGFGVIIKKVDLVNMILFGEKIKNK